MSRLEPCPSCSRHVRADESACPFCLQALSFAELPPRPQPRKRLGRAATFAFGASVVGATTLVGCEGEEEPGDVVPVYGAPAAGMSSGGSSPSEAEGGQGGEAATDSGGTGGVASAVYGAPPGGEGAP